MFIGWLTCIPAVLLPHSPCRFTTANAPANRQMPIASVVMAHNKKNKKNEIMEILDIINSTVLLILGVLYFAQDRTLKFMKTAMDAFDPEKLLSAQKLIDKANEAKIKLTVDSHIDEIVKYTSLQFQETHKDFVKRHNEFFNYLISDLRGKDLQERERILLIFPENATLLRQLLLDYDKGKRQ
jgi:hypothetical protein